VSKVKKLGGGRRVRVKGYGGCVKKKTWLVSWCDVHSHGLGRWKVRVVLNTVCAGWRGGGGGGSNQADRGSWYATKRIQAEKDAGATRSYRERWEDFPEATIPLQKSSRSERRANG